MRERRYPITIVLLWVTIIFTGFIGENVALLSPDPRHGYQLRMFLLISIMTLAFAVMYVVLELKKNKNKLDVILLAILGVIFIVNSLIIMLQPSHQEIVGKIATISVDFSLKDKIIFIAQLFFMMVTAYIFLGPFKKKPYALRVQNWMYWGHTIFAIITFITSIILDYKEYGLFFSEGGEAYIHGIKAYYTNPNLYGTTMMFALLTVMVMQIKKHRFYNTMLMVFFIVAGIFSACATTVFVSVFVFVCYYVFDAIYSFRRSPTLTSVRIIYALLLTLTVTLVTIILYDLKVVFVETPVNFCLKRYIFEGQGGFMSFETRIPIWQSATRVFLSSPGSALFGNGYNLATRLVSADIKANIGWNLEAPDYYVMNCHSAFFEILVRFGVVGLTIYIGLLIDFIVSIIYLFKKKMVRYAFVFLLCFIAVVMHGITEVTMFFDITTKGITITIFFFVPVISQRRMFMSEGKKDSIPYRHLRPSLLSFNTVMKIIFNVLSMVLLGAFSLLFAKESYKGLNIIYVLTILASLVFFIFVGVLIDCKVNKKSFKECFKNDMKYTFTNNLLIIAITLIVGVISSLVISYAFTNSLLTQLVTILFVSSAYFFLWIFIKNDENHLTINELNNYMLYKISSNII